MEESITLAICGHPEIYDTLLIDTECRQKMRSLGEEASKLDYLVSNDYLILAMSFKEMLLLMCMKTLLIMQ